MDNVLNLADYQFFLFEEARYPAIVVTYRKPAPENRQHVEELLRVPFPLPDATAHPLRSREIVKEVAKVVSSATNEASGYFVDRAGIVRQTTEAIEKLVGEYFDILPVESVLIDDTAKVIAPSVRPTRARQTVPTISPSTERQQRLYVERVCGTLNGWAKSGPYVV